MLTSTIWYIPKENVVTAPKLETRECRQFLLYTEIVDLKDTVRNEQYYKVLLKITQNTNTKPI